MQQLHVRYTHGLLICYSMEPGVHLRVMHGKNEEGKKKVNLASDVSVLLKPKDCFNMNSYFMFKNRSKQNMF